MYGEYQQGRTTVALPIDTVVREIERGLAREGLVQIARTDGSFTRADGERRRLVVVDAMSPPDAPGAAMADGTRPLVTTVAVHEVGYQESAIVVASSPFGEAPELGAGTPTQASSNLRDDQLARILERLHWRAERYGWVSSAA